MALVLEEAPMGSLQNHLMDKTPIHRLVIHRMAAQVAAALHFLHSAGIIFCNLKAANVFLWSLSPNSLCHCKLTDFGIATHLAPVGAKALQGTKDFIAPEVFDIGKRKQLCIYDPKADIYSFSMFLYQIIARRHPFYDLKPHRIDNAVELGKRPKLQDDSQAETAFHTLTQLMKCCWEDNIDKRPSTEEIIKSLCLSSVQSIMSVVPVKSSYSVRHMCSVTVDAFTRVRAPHINSSELWLCCDGMDGTELNIINTNTMTKLHKRFTKDNQVLCISLCGDHVWMGTGADNGPGSLEIFSIHSRDVVHSVRMNEVTISCITCTDSDVYLGTTEGYCLSFSRNIEQIRSSTSLKCKYVSENVIDGILAINETVWASHTQNIHFLDTSTMTVDREGLHHAKGALVGTLSLSADGNTVWSAHFGSAILTAWDTHRRVGKFDVDVSRHLKNILPASLDHDMFITAMTPALDTVWVGMATGHILVFHDEELLTWYHSYRDYIRFLSCIPCSGPTTTESCMVVSGGKKFTSSVPSFNSPEDRDAADNPGVLVLWEAYDARATRQIKLVENNAPSFFKNHQLMKRMIQRGEFEDGTNLFHHRDTWEVESSQEVCYQTDQPQFGSSDATQTQEPQSLVHGSLLHNSIQFTQRQGQENSESKSPAIPEEPPNIEQQTPSLVHSIPHETVSFDIRLSGTEDSTNVRVTCQKPIKLKAILSTLQVDSNVPEEQCLIEYRLSDCEECVPVCTQEQLEAYLQLENKPQLFISNSQSM